CPRQRPAKPEDGASMEPSGGNQWRPVASGRAPRAAQQADRQPVATDGNRFGAHGKEGVDGSSPSEGSEKARMSADLCMSSVVAGTLRAWMEPFMNLSRRERRRREPQVPRGDADSNADDKLRAGDCPGTGGEMPFEAVASRRGDRGRARAPV